MAEGSDDKRGTDDALPDFIETDNDAAPTAEAKDAAAAELQAKAAAAAAEAAAAAAAAAAAKAAAEAARLKAEAEATAKAVGDDAAPSKASEEAAPAAAPRAKSGRPAPEPAFVVRPHEEGLFEPGPNVRKPESDLAPLTVWERRRSALAFVALALAIGVLVAAGVVVSSNEQYSDDMRCFIAGKIVECKEANIIKLKKKWKEDDRAAANRYGDITLVYFPPDAKVKITQYVYKGEGLDGEPKQVAVNDIPNASLTLKDGQTIERLPITNMPIFETEKYEDGPKAGDVKTATYYEYSLEFSREGYYPRKFWLRKKGAPLPPHPEGKGPKGATIQWQQLGPGNMQIPWPGLDLEAKEETVMANFLKVRTQLHCLMVQKQIQMMQDVPEADLEIIRLKNGFKTQEDLLNAQEKFTAGKYKQWWDANWAAILEDKCDGSGPPPVKLPGAEGAAGASGAKGAAGAEKKGTK